MFEELKRACALRYRRACFGRFELFNKSWLGWCLVLVQPATAAAHTAEAAYLSSSLMYYNAITLRKQIYIYIYTFSGLIAAASQHNCTPYIDFFFQKQ